MKKHLELVKWSVVSIFGVGIAWGVFTSTTRADIVALNKSLDVLAEESRHHHKEIDEHTIAIKLIQKDITYIAEGMQSLTGKPRHAP